jgi:hypothetical protein
MFSYEKIIIELTKQCAENGIKTAQAMANQGNIESLYLYFKKSTEKENGILVLVPDSEKAPENFELATGEALRCNVPFNEYFRWIKSRINRLPILAYGN